MWQDSFRLLIIVLHLKVHPKYLCNVWNHTDFINASSGALLSDSPCICLALCLDTGVILVSVLVQDIVNVFLCP
jgi:hypothetical protein